MISLSMISLDRVIERLGLVDAPKSIVYDWLARQSSDHAGLGVYCQVTLRAVEYDDEPEPIFDDIEDRESPTKFLIAQGESQLLSGEKKIMRFTPGASLSEVVYFCEFIQGAQEFVCCDEPGMYVESASVRVADLYCYEHEVDACKQRLEADAKAQKPEPKLSEPGLRKAVALLAHEMAVSKPKFRIGGSVNCSAIQRHLVELANTYEKSDGNIKQFNTKLGDILEAFDLKEVKTGNAVE